MSAKSDIHLSVVHSHREARHRKLWRVLDSHGVLTRGALREFAHSEGWDVSFERVLERAVASGCVRELGHDLYVAGIDPLQGRDDGDDHPSAA